jgi:phosphoglycerate dehydrogenase-like enzyme
MGKILITPRSLTKEGHPALDALKKAGHQVVTCTPGKMPDEAELLSLLPGCLGYLAGVEKVSARVLEAAKGLKVISRNGAGIDNVDLEAARRLGIEVRPAPGANARGVAELTVALVFALLRWLPWSDGQLKRQVWNRRQGLELAGRTLGLVGCGNIGRIVVELATAVGMSTLAFKRHPDPSFAPPRFRWVSPAELYAGSDVISLHCPAGARPVIDREALAAMKKGAFLVNTARAGVADEQAVLEALDSGRLAGYAVDVFAQEPPKDWKLATHEKVIATPHIGGFTEESVSRATEDAVRNILEVLK